jgi:hypothetical protein
VNVSPTNRCSGKDVFDVSRCDRRLNDGLAMTRRDRVAGGYSKVAMLFRARSEDPTAPPKNGLDFFTSMNNFFYWLDYAAQRSDRDGNGDSQMRARDGEIGCVVGAIARRERFSVRSGFAEKRQHCLKRSARSNRNDFCCFFTLLKSEEECRR